MLHVSNVNFHQNWFARHVTLEVNRDVTSSLYLSLYVCLSVSVTVTLSLTHTLWYCLSLLVQLSVSFSLTHSLSLFLFTTFSLFTDVHLSTDLIALPRPRHKQHIVRYNVLSLALPHATLRIHIQITPNNTKAVVIERRKKCWDARSALAPLLPAG